MREQPLRRLHAHLVDDERAPIAALGDVAVVAEALHQLRPGPAHALGAPAGARRLAREPVARHRRDHHVERVRRRSPPWAVGSVSGSMIFSCSMIEPGQPWLTIERQRVLVLRANVDEVDVQPVDLGDELREGVQARLARAPVVFRHPVAARASASWRAARPATDPRRSPSPASSWPRCDDGGPRVPLPECRCGRGGWCCLRPLRPAPREAGQEVGAAVVFSDIVFSVIASPLIRARGQTARAVRGREGHRRLLRLASPRDHPGHAPRRPSVGAGKDRPPRVRAGQPQR